MNRQSNFLYLISLLALSLFGLGLSVSSCDHVSDPYEETVFVNAVHRQYRNFELIPNHAQLVAWPEAHDIAVRCRPRRNQLPIGLELVNQSGKVVFQQQFPVIKPKGVIEAPFRKLPPGPYDLQVYFDSGEMIKTWITVP